MIKFITAEDTLPLRSRVLRNGLAPAECYFEADQLPTTFHLGYFHPDIIPVSILSCQLESMEGYEGLGYRLRGMATDSDWQGKGLGSHLLQEAITYLTNDLHADYLWCNARRIAYGFYRNMGFQFVSEEEFEIPGIGPHMVAYKPL